MHPCNRTIQVIRRSLSTTGRLKVYYPNLLNLPDIQVQRGINLMTQGLVQTMVWESGFWAEPKMSLQGDYQVRLNACCLFSYTQTNHQYIKRAAHGLTVMRSATTDIRKGQLLMLNDLFLPNTPWRERINQIIKEAFEARQTPMLTEFSDIGEFPGYYLTPEGVVIYFQAYEYTPFVVGLPEFLIPYSQLKPFIGPQSPLAPLL